MASETPAYVTKITVTKSRVDAIVIIGATRYVVSLNPGAQSLDAIQTAIDTLSNELIEVARSDLKELLSST